MEDEHREVREKDVVGFNSTKFALKFFPLNIIPNILEFEKGEKPDQSEIN